MRDTKDRAITLIALVITIIVLLILAGVSIVALTGDNGLLTRASAAKDKDDKATEDENFKIGSYENEINKVFEIEGGIVTGVSRETTWDGATMLTATISNITGGTFTINVNNVEAHNYGTLYYYVNGKLIHEGSESSFQVTEFNGKAISDNTTYKVKVLAEPFELSVTTGEGDNVDSWLACIGNSNEQGYTLNNLDKLIENTTLMNDLLSSSTAMDYLLASTEIIDPYISNICCASNTYFSILANDSTIFAKICESSLWRNAMYDNYSVTESIIASSSNAKECMKKSSRYQVVSKTMTKSFQTFYDGKVFVLGVSQAWDRDTNFWITHGNYIKGNQTLSQKFSDSYGTNGLVVSVNKFASTAVFKQGYDNTHTGYMAIFKI